MHARVAALLVAALFPAPAPKNQVAQVAAELEAARHTRELIAAKLDARDKDLRVRVRALYKLTAFGELPLWVDDGARDDFLHRRAAGTRVIVRDLEERAELRTELAAADADVARLSAETERVLAASTPLPPAASLTRPVFSGVHGSFGIYIDDATKARISRHGVVFAPLPTAGPAVAVADGTVLYAGPIRGLGQGVVVDHGNGLVTVTAGLSAVTVAHGDAVTRGAPVGAAAAAARVYLEVRLAGRPIDPAPLVVDSRSPAPGENPPTRAGSRGRALP